MNKKQNYSYIYPDMNSTSGTFWYEDGSTVLNTSFRKESNRGFEDFTIRISNMINGKIERDNNDRALQGFFSLSKFELPLFIHLLDKMENGETDYIEIPHLSEDESGVVLIVQKDNLDVTIFIEVFNNGNVIETYSYTFSDLEEVVLFDGEETIVDTCNSEFITFKEQVRIGLAVSSGIISSNIDYYNDNNSRGGSRRSRRTSGNRTNNNASKTQTSRRENRNTEVEEIDTDDIDSFIDQL